MNHATSKTTTSREDVARNGTGIDRRLDDKRLWRVYWRLRLNLPRRTKKRLPVRLRQPLVVIPQPNVVWALDFMSDTLYGRRRFRILNILDEGVREVLAIQVATSLPAERVIRVLEQVTAWRGQPQAIRLDNGPEFLADRFATWCAERGIALRFLPMNTSGEGRQ